MLSKTRLVTSILRPQRALAILTLTVLLLCSACVEGRGIRGFVNPAGNPATFGGDFGFSSTKSGVGMYRVTFDNPFPAVPHAVVTPHSGIDRTAVIPSTATPTHFDVMIFNSAGNQVDGGFFFHVIGPR